jgi:hypothetical protein
MSSSSCPPLTAALGVKSQKEKEALIACHGGLLSLEKLFLPHVI